MLASLLSAADGPSDVGSGASYDPIVVQLLSPTTAVAGDILPIVTQSRWSDGRWLTSGEGLLTIIVHWPRNFDDSPRAYDVWAFLPVRDRGYTISGFAIPIGVVLPEELSADARMELSMTAFQPSLWPSQGFGSNITTLTIRRAE